MPIPTPRVRPPRRPDHPARSTSPTILLSPLAMLKLSYLCHAAETEIGGFGVSGEKDLLYVDDFELLRQASTIASTDLDDEAVADHIERYAERGIEPVRCGRIWIHTHPGSSPTPSMTDEQTFSRCFGGCDWSVMLILARGGAFYARLQFGVGPGAAIEVPVKIDWSAWPGWSVAHASDLPHLIPLWDQQLRDLVHTPTPMVTRGSIFALDELDDADWRRWFDQRHELEELHDC